jgi:hypothetical protein
VLWLLPDEVPSQMREDDDRLDTPRIIHVAGSESDGAWFGFTDSASTVGARCRSGEGRTACVGDLLHPLRLMLKFAGPRNMPSQSFF